MNNWINVKDRMPYSELVLVKLEGLYTYGLAARGLNGKWGTDDGKTPIKNVTHWHPLPGQPNEESVGNQEDGIIDSIIERSHTEGLETKMKRLMDAVKELHPTLAMDDPKHEELYLSLHSLKESVTSL